jgi:uncharacterized membrane protein YcaP (DUF421 family)
MDWLNDILGLGLEAKDLTFVQISLRGIIVFFSSLAMIRLGAKRFLAKKTAFDVILGLILASMLARAVNGTASFFPTLGGAFVVICVHRGLALLSFHSHWIGNLVKGSSDVLISDGVMQRKGMAKNHITENDLLEDLRLNAEIETVAKVGCARIERSGDISVIPKEKQI